MSNRRRLPASLLAAFALLAALAPIAQARFGAAHGSRAIRVPPQSVLVTPRGEAIVFLSCAAKSTACRGTLTLRIASAERGIWESRPGTGEWRSLPVAWRRWAARAPQPAVIVHRRLLLRQRRVDPVTLRLRRPVLALLRHDGAPVQLEAVTSWGYGRRSVGLIRLQLAGRRTQLA